MTLTGDTLDELALDLGYRLDVILIRQEIADDLVSLDSVHNRVDTMALAYGVTKAEVIERIGGLG